MPKGMYTRTHARPRAERFWPKVDRRGPTECWPWMAYKGHRDYGRFDRGELSHRVAYELTFGPIPPGMFVMHSCDNPPCCNPAHLTIGTHLDNMADAVSKGRMLNEPKGITKLSSAQVLEIRARYVPRKVTYEQLAAEYGVGMQNIYCVVKRLTWTHL